MPSDLNDNDKSGVVFVLDVLLWIEIYIYPFLRNRLFRYLANEMPINLF